MAEKITFNTGAKNYEIVDQDGNELGIFCQPAVRL